MTFSIKTFATTLSLAAFALLAMYAAFLYSPAKVSATSMSPVVIYDSIPSPQPGSSPSVGYQATQTDELGDYVQFGGTERTLTTVDVLLNSWACQQGGWNTHDCANPDSNNTGYDHPVTVTIYSVDTSGPTPVVGSPIATVTQTVHVPWRPASDPSCSGGGYLPDCNNGYNFVATFDFTSQHIILPEEVVYGVSFNTQSYGASPIGSSGPYNSLNFSVPDVTPSTGTDVDPDALFWNTHTANNYTDHGAGGTGTFREDTNWSGKVPAVRIHATAPDVSGVQFVNSPKYVRENNGGDLTAQIVAPTSVTAVNFYVDGSSSPIAGTNVGGAGADTDWWRLYTPLPAGEHTISAKVQIGSSWYDASNTGTTYSLDAPTAEYIIPAPGQTFRPNDKVVRVKADDEFDQFKRMVVTVGGADHEVLRSACSDQGDYVLCDLENLGLAEGTYTADTTTYTKANNRYDHLISSPFIIDGTKPSVLTLDIENDNSGVVDETVVAAAEASDNLGVESVNFYVTEPRNDGVCTGNGTQLASERVMTPDGDSKYRSTVDVSGLPDGDYCVSAVSRDNGWNNSLPKNEKVTVQHVVPLPQVHVAIFKYIDGAPATSGSANGLSFPMHSSWNAANIGSGSGDYTLSPSGYATSTPYAAVTSAMDSGADYSTNETIDGSTVYAADSDVCPAGKFRFVGYRTGDTREEAEGAALSADAPAFTNLTSDKYVIVENTPCPVPPAIPTTPVLLSPEDGHATSTNDFYFRWNPSAGEAPITYEFQSSQNPAESGGVLTTGVWHSGVLPSPFIHSTGAPDGAWYWQVRAKDTDGDFSPWSGIWRMTIDHVPPAAPTITAPTNEETFNSTPILDAWTTVSDDANGHPDASGIAKYQIAYLYDDGHTFGGSTCPEVTEIGGKPVSGCRDTTSTSRNHSPSTSEQGGVTIYVRAFDKAGNAGAWSDPVHYVYDVNGTPGPAPAHLVIVKHTTDSSEASFSFSVEGDSYSGTVDLTTDDSGEATSDALNLEPGTYDVTEAAQDDWTLAGVSCDGGSPSDIENGKEVTIGNGTTVTCTFTNKPGSTETITVYRGSLATSTSDVAANPTKWFFYNDRTGSVDGTEGISTNFGAFVNGPAVAPLGEGSVQISVPDETGCSSGGDTCARRNIATYQFSGTPLADITQMKFSTYNPSAGNGGSASRSAYLNFNVDFDGSDTWQRRLAFVPSQNGSVAQNSWQEWDAIQGGNAKYSYSGATWPDTSTPGSTLRTWNDIVTNYPGVRIRVTDSWLGLRVGEPYPDGYTENLDKFLMTVDDGTHATTTIVNFEPDVSTQTAITNISPEPSVTGQTYTVEWSVTPTTGSDTPTGTVSVTVNGGSGCSAAASAGSCEVPAPSVAGNYSVKAEFDGDPGFVNSSSGTETHVVNAAPVSSPQVTSFTTSSGGNGPPAGLASFGGVQGQVLGASTSASEQQQEQGGTQEGGACSALVTSFLGQGRDNDTTQVRALQQFLNDENSAGLPVTGFFGQLTDAAVRNFQVKYWQDILAPWVPYGLFTDHTPTGLVGKTTAWKINMLHCPSLGLPFPQIP